MADDVVSHVLRRAILKLHELGSSHAAWQWLTTTGRNHLTDIRRRRPVEANRLERYQREHHIHADVAAPPDLVSRVAEELGDQAGDDELRLGGRIPVDRAEWEARLAALSATDRRLLELVEVEGKSHAEAALDLGLASPAASRKRHSRARHFLRTGIRAP